ncbi:ABC1 kinase family protein [Ornithinicoccus halotolerans]|uniref:ABC1 kinase family protein n=1 Tax=Ornithinicoccus halotolerans TaxID=1748220 RepID=UPI001885BFE8|nr:AarF/ABC1/UbiB kinase family protein [Ornithinicoccus halotolerans]
MADQRGVPTTGLGRARRLASLPLGAAGRAVRGAGQRLTGTSAQEVSRRQQEQAAEELFAVLGELKGGAQKVGQQLSIFEAAVPGEFVAPYREALTRLQEQAPPVPFSDLEPVLTRSLGADWRSRFQDIDQEAAASASIGQVHRARWRDGREVAVKIQYPWAGPALSADLRQLARVARLARPLVPGMDLGAVVEEVQERMLEELDYRREAWSQQVFADAYADDPEVQVPPVLDHGEQVLVTEWLEGTPLSRLIARAGDGVPGADPAARATLEGAAPRYIGFLLGAPDRVGLLHADPHPGNYRVLPDGRLGVLDFGAVDRLPEGLPLAMGRLLGVALRQDADTLLDGLREEGFIRDWVDLDPEELLDFFEPLVAPVRHPTFRFDRAWLRGVSSRVNDPRGTAFRITRRLDLPVQYLLIHRVWMGGTAVLSQMGVEIPARAVVDRHVPGLELDS